MPIADLKFQRRRPIHPSPRRPIMPPDPSAPAVPKRTALIVDDFPSVRFYHSFVLEKAGFRCRMAHDGQEALTLLTKEGADLIVLDLVMPEMGGQEFIKHLHESPTLAHLPVLIISTEHIGERIRRERTAKTGPVGFAQKPIMPAKILDEVRHLLTCQSTASASDA